MADCRLLTPEVLDSRTMRCTRLVKTLVRERKRQASQSISVKCTSVQKRQKTQRQSRV